MSSEDRAGQWIRQAEGYKSFIPHALPPLLHLTMSDFRLIEQTGKAIGQLNSLGTIVGNDIANPYLLLQGFIRQEAVVSSRIEGTVATIDDIYDYELEELEDGTGERPSHGKEDTQEVYNYVRALTYGLAELKRLPICSRLVLDLHRILMSGVRGENKAPGEFRKTQNFIGGRGTRIESASFVPPPHLELDRLINDWENYINTETDEPQLIKCALMHAQFEMIHPFMDGNGRVGRLLITLFLIEQGMQELPLVYLSAFFERNRRDYYDGLSNISTRDEWEEWLRFFLEGVLEQAGRISNSLSQMLDLKINIEGKLKLKKLSGIHFQAIDYLFQQPVITAKLLEKKLEISTPYANRLIKSLMENEIIIEKTGKARNRKYSFEPYMRIIRGL